MAVVVALVFLASFDSCALPVAFVPSVFVLARVSAAVAVLVVGVAAPCVVFGPDLRVVPQLWRVPVLAAAVIVGVPAPAERAVAPALAGAFCLNWN